MNAYKKNTILSTLLPFIFIFLACYQSHDCSSNIFFDFEDDVDLDRITWKCPSMFSISDEWSENGTKSLKFEFYPSKQIGFSTGEIAHNWTNAKTFDFSVFNPDSHDIEIFIRISDNMTNGDSTKAFVSKLICVPGINRITLPVDNLIDSTNRPLHLDDIKGFYIYKRDVVERTVLYFDYFRLKGEK